jgi:hypothetical protein
MLLRNLARDWTRVSEELKFLELIAVRLDSVGIPYMLTGSMAMMFYALPRMTRDVDLVLECHADDVPGLVDAFSVDCYIDAATVRESVKSRSMFNVIHNEWAMKADFILRKHDVYRELEFRRRRKMVLGEFSVSVVSVEDLILSKLLWAAGSGSEFQYRDVSTMLASVAEIDDEYLDTWATQLGVRKKLSELRRA